MNAIELGERVNHAGREFKVWFTDFTLVYSPIFIVLGLILTGVDLFLNLGLGNSLWFKLPWSIAQLFAVDGLWFAVWNRILTDEYKWRLFLYHAFIILLGLAMTGIAITMNLIIFTQDYMGLKDAVTAMNQIGIPVSLFLITRSIMLMLTATLAIVLDKVMRSKVRYKKVTTPKPETKPEAKPEKSNEVHVPGTVVQEVNEPAKLLQIEPAKPAGYRDAIRSTIEQFIAEGRKYTYQDIASATGASLQTVKVHAPKIKAELAAQKEGE